MYGLGVQPDDYSPSQAADAAGVTSRQLDHWTRRRWIEASVSPGSDGRGNHRIYSAQDVQRAQLIARLAEAGWKLAEIGPRLRGLDLNGGHWLLFDQDRTLILQTAEDLDAALSTATKLTLTVIEPALQRTEIRQ